MTLINEYAIGQGVTLRFTFKNADDALTDPSSAAFHLRRPDNEVVTDYTLDDATRESAGIFTLEVVPDVAGDWYYRGVGDGDLACATLDTYFRVKESLFA